MKGSNVTVCPFVVQESYLRNTYIHTYIHTEFLVYVLVYVMLSVCFFVTIVKEITTLFKMLGVELSDQQIKSMMVTD